MVELRHSRILFGLIAAIVFLDQSAKYLIQAYLPLDQEIILIPKLLSLTHLTNTGASFGILRGMNSFLIVLGLGVVVFLFYQIYQKEQTEPLWPFALIIGGAISNVLDRVMHGFVIDFIQIPFWPSFNIADSAITIGVITLIIYSLRTKTNAGPQNARSQP
jgi:signal peptidase II